MSASAKASDRATRFWRRLTEWYGTRLTDTYGSKIPSDWADLVDDHDNEQVKAVLSQIRTKFVSYPPSLPEVDGLFSRSVAPVMANLPCMQSTLCKFVLKNRTLTPRQRITPWTYLGRGDVRSGVGFEITGVMVPADGDVPGFRMMVEDMAMFSEQVA